MKSWVSPTQSDLKSASLPSNIALKTSTEDTTINSLILAHNPVHDLQLSSSSKHLQK